MKLNLRIILINFAIVIIILGGAAIAFYSIMFNIIESQQKRHLQNSANNLLIALDDIFSRSDNSLAAFFRQLDQPRKDGVFPELPPGLDFVAKIQNDSTFDKSRFFHSENIYHNDRDYTVNGFFRKNPFIVIREHTDSRNQTYYYGLAVNKDFINNLSVRIGAELAVYLPDKQVEMSNENINLRYLYIINSSHDHLVRRSNFEVYTYQSGSNFLISTIYRVGHSLVNAGDLTLIIYSVLNEAEGLRSSVSDAIIILAVVGVILSLILTYTLTLPIRRQLNELNTATGIVKTGNFKERLQLESKDEIGELGEAFNKMLDELDKQEQIKKDYTDFITLINSNPKENEISATALSKIMKADKLVYAVIYAEQGGEIKHMISEGEIDREVKSLTKSNLIKDIFASGTESETRYTRSSYEVSGDPEQKSNLRILMLPVIYGYRVIAVIELCSEHRIKPEVKEYILKIVTQLAIGLNNTQTLQILENLVAELKQLNEESNRQNIKITGQNEKLRELHSQLSQKARELEVQKKRAEELTELKSKFLATISHELRTPMSTILGLTDLIMKSGIQDQKTSERLEVVLRSGKRLLSLINGVLDLSKIEAGKMDVNKEIFLLKDIIDELENTFSVMASAKNLDFEIKCDIPTETRLNTDRHKLLQILINLMGNSVKFTEKGRVELNITDANYDGVKFEVVDSGIGIDPEQQKIIFEEFRQVDSSSTRKYGGSGLGLSISQKFAALIGGQLYLSSVPETGSVFTLIVPAIVVEDTNVLLTAEASELQTVKETPKIAELKTGGKDKEVLIVDDDPDTLFTLNELVRNFGYRTMLAKNGLECLEILEKKIPGLILLDIMMPKMDGFQTINAIRKEKKFDNLPIYAVTAKAMADEKDSILAAGFDDFISKPVNPPDLEMKIAFAYSTGSQRPKD